MIIIYFKANTVRESLLNDNILFNPSKAGLFEGSFC